MRWGPLAVGLAACRHPPPGDPMATFRKSSPRLILDGFRPGVDPRTRFQAALTSVGPVVAGGDSQTRVALEHGAEVLCQVVDGVWSITASIEAGVLASLAGPVDLVGRCPLGGEPVVFVVTLDPAPP